MNRNKFLVYLLDSEKKIYPNNNILNVVSESILFLAALIPVFLLVGSLFTRLTVASYDLRFVEVMPLGRDEAYVATNFWTSWERGVPLFGSIYGSLYFNIAFIVAKFLDFFSPLTQSTAIVLLRSISLFCYLLSAVALYIIFRRKIGVLAAISITLCFTLISYNDDFVRRITICQPDMLNLFCGVLILYGILEVYKDFTVRALIYVSVFTGLFMSVKHSGFIFFPLIFLVFVSSVIGKKENEIDDLKNRVFNLFFKTHLFLAIISAGVCLFLNFLVGNSYQEILLIVNAATAYFLIVFLVLWGANALYKMTFVGKYPKLFTLWLCLFCFFDLFLLVFSVSSIGSVYPDLSFLSNLSRLNSFFSAVSGGFLNWWKMITERILSYWYVIVIISGLSFMLVNPGQNLIRKEKQLYFLMLYWLSGSLLIIMLTVGLVADRYLFPFFPFLVYVLVMPVLYFFRFLLNQLKLNGSTLLIAITVFYLFFLLTAFRNHKKIQQDNAIYARVDIKPGVLVGEWLKSNCNDTVRILLDSYAYIPSNFFNVKMLDYGDPYVQLQSFKPDIIILNDYYKRLYNSTPDEEISSANLIKAKISKSFYSFFDRNTEYELIKELQNEELNEGFRIFKKRGL